MKKKVKDGMVRPNWLSLDGIKDNKKKGTINGGEAARSI